MTFVELECDMTPWAQRERKYLDRGRFAPIRSGFTLIELLLVLVILAALAAIVTPKFTKRSEQARITAAKTQISQFEVALDAFEIDLGRYPTTSEGLRALVEKPTSDAEQWQQPYLRRGVPEDPWGNDYVYRYPGQHNEEGYDLYSMGPDGRQGGDDDIINWSEED
jgi:general secretion pathway protein G